MVLMPGNSEYERLQIESLLAVLSIPIERQLAVHLLPQTDLARFAFQSAVVPAMAQNELNVREIDVVFDSDSNLADVAGWLIRAEVIVADISDWCPDVAYLVGLCHAMGRCPILIGRRPVKLPFNLHALRWIEYQPTTEGYFALREELARSLRVFLTAARATQRPGN